MLETHFANLPVTDLAKDDTYRNLFDEALAKIAASSDPLKDNYVNLNPKEYISFPAVIKDGKIACFSGVIELPHRWGSNIARVSTRMWVDYQYRFAGLIKFRGGARYMNTTYCLPMQMQKAREAGIKCVFISREGKNILGFRQYLGLIKTNCNLDFKLLDNKYNTCGPIEPMPTGCIQHVAIHALTPDGEEVWHQAMGNHLITE